MDQIIHNGPVVISGIVLPPLLIALSSLLGKNHTKRLGNLTFIAAICSSLFSVILFFTLSQSPTGFQFMFIIFKFSLDALSAYFIVLTNIVTLFTSFFTRFSIRQGGEIRERNSQEPRSVKFFYLQFNLFYCSMLLVPMVDNLFVIWVLLTFTMVISAPLIAYRQDRRTREAAWRYIMISSVGMVFALLGTLFLVGAFHSSSTDILNWSDLTNALKTHLLILSLPGQTIVKLSFLLILLGYGAKAGLFPMHTWLADGYSKTPSTVSTLLSGVLLKSALYVLLRFYVITNLALQSANGGFAPFASNTLLILGLLSLIMASLFILNTKKENHFKRVLAYISLGHMGIITFGFGLGGGLAIFGALLQTLNHSLAKSLMFLAYGNVQSIYQREQIPDEDIHGVFQAMPLIGCFLVLGGLALVGAPPFSISLSEFIILWAALQKASGSVFGIIAAFLFLIALMLMFGGMIAHMGRVMLGKSPFPPGKTYQHTSQLFMLAGLLFLLIWGGWSTFPISALLERSVHILCQGGCP